MITQKELAAMLGVSAATVSRALAGSEQISRTTRRRIFQAARQNGCFSRSNTVALLIPSFSLYGYFSEVCSQLLRELDYSGFRPIILSGKHLELLEELDLCGAISIFALNGLEKYWGKNHIMPLVCINTAPNHLEGIFTVSSNDEQAMRTAVKYLYALGHRKIGRLAFPGSIYPENNWNSMARKASFEQIISEYGLSSGFAGAITQEDCFNSLKRLIEAGVTAMIIQDETLETSVLHALRCMNCRVPEDLSLISLSFAGVGQKLYPSLTTLEQNFPQIVRCSCDIFRNLLKGEKIPGDVFVDYSFIPRESTAVPPHQRLEGAKA